MAAPWCWMADWHGLCGQLQEGRANAADWKGVTQNLNDVGIEWDLQDEAAPAHVTGLTCGGRDNSTIPSTGSAVVGSPALEIAWTRT